MPKIPAEPRIPEFILKLVFTRRLREMTCSHLDLIQVTEPDTDVCQDCVVLGDT